MKRLFFTILGIVILLPVYFSDVFGIDISDLQKSVYKPENLPGATKAAEKNLPLEAKVNLILSYATNLILYASGSAAVLFLVYGGFRYVTSFGNDKQTDEAKKIIKYSLIGLLAVIFAYAIVTNIIKLIYRSTI